MTTEIIPAEAQRELIAEKDTLENFATGLTVNDRRDYDRAYNFAKEVILPMKSKVKELFQPPVDSAKKAYDDARGLRDTFLKPIEMAEKTVRAKADAWLTYENARIAAEREAESKKYAQGLKKAERKAERTGTPVALPIAPIAVPVATVSGPSRTTWSAQVTDIKALCKAVAEGKAPAECVLANMPVLNGLARASKSQLSIAGVKAISHTSGTIR